MQNAVSHQILSSFNYFESFIVENHFREVSNISVYHTVRQRSQIPNQSVEVTYVVQCPHSDHPPVPS